MLDRKLVQDELHDLHASQLCLAKLAGISEPLVCKWLSGGRELSPGSELRVAQALHMMHCLVQISPAPPDFSRVGEIFEATKRFRVQLDANDAKRVQAAVAGDEAAGEIASGV